MMNPIKKYDDASTPYVESGRVSNTDGTVTTLINARPNLQFMIDVISVVNTSATTVYVDFLSGSTIVWTTIAPTGGGSNITFPRPLPCLINSSTNFQSSSGVSTIIVSIAGHFMELPE